tara:strand:- start:171 stop:368 length:198 start_codon:yes stop_codon:yes gene_type:complete
METGFAIFTLAVTGLLLGMIHMTRQAEQQRKAELVPVRVKRNSRGNFTMDDTKSNDWIDWLGNPS